LKNYICSLAKVSIFALVSGCVTPYQLPPGAPVAKLHLNTAGTLPFKVAGSTWICVTGQRQRLKTDPAGDVDIPAGKRVTFGVDFYNYVYGGVSSSCTARSSIIPQPGQRYSSDFQIEAERCHLLLFKEDLSSRTGLALDATFGRPAECLPL
jgi:hypothetical protein